MSEKELYCDRIDWSEYEETPTHFFSSDIILKFFDKHKNILSKCIYTTLNQYYSLYLEFRRIHNSIKNKKKYIEENNNSLNLFKIIKMRMYINCINNERKEIWEIIPELIRLENKETIKRIIKKHYGVIKPKNIAEEVEIRLKLDGEFY